MNSELGTRNSEAIFDLDYDLSDPRIECHADKVAAKVFEFKEAGTAVRVLAYDRESALIIAQLKHLEIAGDYETDCWCGESGKVSELFDDTGLDDSCGGLGVLYCRCGGLRVIRRFLRWFVSWREVCGWCDKPLLFGGPLSFFNRDRVIYGCCKDCTLRELQRARREQQTKPLAMCRLKLPPYPVHRYAPPLLAFFFFAAIGFQGCGKPASIQTSGSKPPHSAIAYIEEPAP